MLRRTLQRLVRLSPSAAQKAWHALPERAKRALAPWVYPIALGARRGGRVLEVERPNRVKRFDVVVGAGMALPAAERESLRERGHRVFDLERAAPAELIRRERALDAVLLVPRGSAAEAVDARRLGWRVAHAAEELERSFPEVCIVIPTHAARELCKSAIHSILRSTGWGRFRIVVVDDASRDGTDRALADLGAAVPELSVVRLERRRGFAAACNAGIERASGDYVVLLNDDTVVGPGWLSRLIAALERDPRLGLVCPLTNRIGNEAQIDVAYDTLDAMERFALERALDHAGECFEIPSLALFCAAARLSTLREVGGLDERYEIGLFEDDDLSRTLRTRGLSLGVAADAFVHHVGQATFGQLSDAEYLTIWEANKRRFESKWGVGWRPPTA